MKPIKKYRVYVDYETKIIEVEAITSEEAEQKAEAEVEETTSTICSTEAVVLDENDNEVN